MLAGAHFVSRMQASQVTPPEQISKKTVAANRDGAGHLVSFCL